MKINGVIAQENQYDSMGTLIRTKDFKTNQEYVHDYDNEGRLIRTTVFDMTLGQLSDRRVYEISWGYDDDDRIICESVYDNGVTTVQHYTYSDKDLLNQIQLDANTKLNYSYDAFERVSSKVIDTASTDITTSYTYAASQRGNAYTTSKIATETIGDTTYAYTYDEIGNITQITITRGSTTEIIQYEYDENSQLKRENNQQTGLTSIYYYDYAGNILGETIYPYATDYNLTMPITSNDYQYADNGYSNQLISYNYSSEILYDSLGNPTSYLGNTMTWNGRDLLTVNNSTNSVSYSYDSNGLRKTKTVNGNTTTYDYNGTQLIHEKRSDCDLYYTYDASGNLSKIAYVKNGVTTNYYVTTNFRGDVEAIYNANGVLQARYLYDPWGKIRKVVDSNDNEITNTSHIGQINPIRYRGYYYDTETKFYYLQSRYYDPEVGRFINGDFQLNSGVLGNNLYIYCGNNPVNYEDDEGTSWTALIALKVAFDIVCDITATAMIKEAAGEEYTALDLCETVVSSIALAPIENYWKAGGYAILLSCFFGTIQGENINNIALSSTTSFIGTSITVNSMLGEIDYVSETINDLTYGSVEYILLTLAETGVENAINKKPRNKTKPLIKPIHEVINFKNIPMPKNKKRGYGFCSR